MLVAVGEESRPDDVTGVEVDACFVTSAFFREFEGDDRPRLVKNDLIGCDDF